MNDELTANDLKNILKECFGVEKVQYSVRSIARPLQDHCKTTAILRNELGWPYKYSCRQCHAI